MKKILFYIAAIACLSACATTSTTKNLNSKVSGEVSGVQIKLPEGVNWFQLTDKTDGIQYLKEWLPDGMNAVTTDWIIAEQKLSLGQDVSAMDFHKTIFSLTKRSCSSVRFNGPDEIKVNGISTSVGRFKCAHQRGTPYGTFTDQRVIAQGKVIYVITSEIRTPPSGPNGLISFDGSRLTTFKAFMKHQKESERFVRESVAICFAGQPKCIAR